MHSSDQYNESPLPTVEPLGHSRGAPRYSSVSSILRAQQVPHVGCALLKRNCLS